MALGVADVTVGIVAYKHAEFVIQALESSRLEGSCKIVFADDASPDRAQEFVREWFEQLAPHEAARVTLLFSTANKGLNATLNEVLARVETDYFVYLAGDDWHTPGRLARQVQTMENDGVDLSYGDAYRADSEGHVMEDTFYDRHPEWFARVNLPDPVRVMLETSNWIAAPTVMLRVETLRSIGGFDESLAYEDYDTYLRMAHVGRLAFVGGEPLGVHRELGDSLGAQIFRPQSLGWIESIARTELKMLSARPDLAENLSKK